MAGKRSLSASAQVASPNEQQQPEKHTVDPAPTSIDLPAAENAHLSAAEQLDENTVRGAVDALIKNHISFQQNLAAQQNTTVEDPNDLLPSDSYFYLQLTFKFPPFKDLLRPRVIPLKHSLFVPGEDEVCFFVRDPQRLVKDYLANHEPHPITRVLGLSKLIERYSTHEARRELLNAYDYFLMDHRIAPSVPRVLGKHFIQSSRMPLPVKMGGDVRASIDRALSGTAFRPRRGTACSLRVARLDFDPKHIVDNIIAVMDGIVSRVNGGWNSLQAVNLKTAKSPALPIFFELPATEKITHVPGGALTKYEKLTAEEKTAIECDEQGDDDKNGADDEDEDGVRRTLKEGGEEARSGNGPRASLKRGRMDEGKLLPRGKKGKMANRRPLVREGVKATKQTAEDSVSEVAEGKGQGTAVEEDAVVNTPVTSSGQKAKKKKLAHGKKSPARKNGGHLGDETANRSDGEEGETVNGQTNPEKTSPRRETPVRTRIGKKGKSPKGVSPIGTKRKGVDLKAEKSDGSASKLKKSGGVKAALSTNGTEDDKKVESAKVSRGDLDAEVKRTGSATKGRKSAKRRQEGAFGGKSDENMNASNVKKVKKMKATK